MDMYREVQFCVKLDQIHCTNNFNSSLGVKQGCVLSPALFNIFLSDLPQIFNDVNCNPVKLGDIEITSLMYADDIILMSETKGGLQEALNALGSYCSKWQLTVNVNKTKTIVFNSNNKLASHYIFKYKNMTIENVNSYRYLGIDFTSSGSFKFAQKIIKEKALKALFMLKTLNIRHNITTANKLFDALVLPVLRYGSEVWCSFAFSKFSSDKFMKLCDELMAENIHIKHCKYVLGVQRRSSNIATKGELGRYPVAIEMIIGCIKYWISLNKNDTHPLVKQSLIECYRLQRNSKQNWLSSIHSILTKLGFGEIWNNCGTLNQNKFISELKLSLKSIYCQKWQEALLSNPESNKLRTYSKFKTNFQLEPYLLTTKNYEKRRIFTQLRISAHDLHIETGRYTKPAKTPVNNRICRFCDKNQIEDEFHVVMECTHYNEFREELCSELQTFSLYDEIPNEDLKFIYLMSGNNGDTEIYQIITNFVHKVWQKRKNKSD